MAITITVASAEVDATLTDFPVAVDLSGMPASFWSNVHREGHNIRIFDDNPTRVPVDVLEIAVGDETGWLVFLAPSLSASSDTEFTLDLGGSYQAPGDSFGRNAVWADYEYVTTLGSGPINRADGTLNRYLHSGTVVNIEAFTETADSSDTIADVAGHDGGVTDGAHFYAFDETAIRKYDLSWNLVATNSSPAADTGLTGADQVEAGTVHDGVIYCPVRALDVSDNPTSSWIAQFRASDLSYVADSAFETTDLGGTGAGLSIAALYYDPDDDLIYGVRWSTGGDDEIVKYDPVAETHEGTIALSASIERMQGIVKWRGAYWITAGDGPSGADARVRYVELDGTIAAYIPIVLADGSVSQAIDVAPGGNGLIVSRNAGGNDEVLTFEPLGFDMGLGAGVELTPTGSRRVICDFSAAGALGTSWLVGLTARTDDNNQDVIAGVADGSTTHVNFVNDNGNNLGIWDTSNSWQYCSPTFNPPTDGTFFRANYYYDGTSERAIYVNGGSKGTDSSITAKGTPADSLVLGANNSGGGDLTGGIGFAYARPSIPTNVDEWVAAEYSMLDDNATFLSITGSIDVTTPPDTPTVTIDQENETSVDMSTSAFSAGEGGSHTDTQWQIRVQGGATVYDPGDDDTNLTTIDDAGSLSPDTVHEGRARHKEDDTTYSEWSAWVEFTTTENRALRYVPMLPGDVLTIAGKFIRGDPSDDTTGAAIVTWFNGHRSQIGSETAIDWDLAETRERIQVSIVVPETLSGFRPLMAVFSFTATGDNGETCGLDYYDAWRNVPPYNLSGTLSLDGSNNVDLEWEASLPCRVKYVANTTGYVSSDNVEANGTFTDASELISDTEEDVLSSLSGTAYVTLVPYDEDDKRSGPRVLVPTVTN